MKWDAALYDNNHGYVSANGIDVLSWLEPQKGEHILDIGCGTGELAHEIALSGAQVIGVDSSTNMIEKAQATYPNIQFEVQDATRLSYEKPFDAVFSNATLHWITDAEKAVQRIHSCLKPGGRFVFEMGGKHNVAHIRNALKRAAKDERGADHVSDDFWFFPSMAEYCAILEQHGFTVQAMSYFERDTPLVGKDGMRNWIDMFGSQLFGNISEEARNNIVDKAIEYLRPTHFREDIWHADYVRLRGRAVKTPS
jgi:trans-aconitate methyltransferase